MSNDRFRQVMVTAGILFALVLNGAANALPLNGQTTAEISDRFQVYVVPAGYVFAIWGLIYIGQLAFLIQTWRPSRLHDALLRRIGLLPALVGLLNGIWILFWHYEIFPLTVVVMVALLVTLIWLYRVAGFEETARFNSNLARSERWLVQVPFSLYLGWITVATIANVAAVGNWANVPTFGIAPEVIAAFVLAIGFLIAATVMVRTSDVTYGAVIIWAYVGVIVKEASTPIVPWVAGVAVLLIIVMIVRALLSPPRQAPTGPLAAA